MHGSSHLPETGAPHSFDLFLPELAPPFFWRLPRFHRADPSTSLDERPGDAPGQVNCDEILPHVWEIYKSRLALVLSYLAFVSNRPALQKVINITCSGDATYDIKLEFVISFVQYAVLVLSCLTTWLGLHE